MSAGFHFRRRCGHRSWPTALTDECKLVRSELAKCRAVPFLSSFSVIAATPSPAAVTGSTRLLRTPTVSATHIAFAYANNIWVVERAGGMARRLTSFAGQTTNPHFSPDGKWLAFSAEYAGNNDVYVVPSEGGEPKRLTWHPGADLVQGWTPDGKSILFSSTRATWAPSAAPRFWTVPARRRRGRSPAAAARLSGQDLTRRQSHRLSHEQFLGRRTPQLSRRAEPPHLDRGSENFRPGLAPMDRLQRHGPGLGR